MDKDEKMAKLEMMGLADEVLDSISGGELTDEEKADCWERVKRFKIVMPLEDFLSFYPEGGEKIDYMVSIWDQVEVPGTFYTPKSPE